MNICFDQTVPLEELVIRDPCILLHDGLYYLYCSMPPGYGCYVSKDLQRWAGPYKVYQPPEGHPGIDCWWAPECHAYQDKFYLFATYKSAITEKRGVSIFCAGTPLGPFEELSRPCPPQWDTIDGTLYVDKQGNPWMVFVHEWTSMPDQVGDFSVAPLSGDLTRFIGEPQPMFKATELPGSPDNHVTDGCWLYRTTNDTLIMLWSGFSKDGYVQAQARSQTGEVTGPWEQLPLLYKKGGSITQDGGHGMIFTTLEGRIMLCMHSPNGGAPARVKLVELADIGDRLDVIGY